jgi:hypothetical protein
MAAQSQFSGPAAFWSLVPLAFNVMLQPSGRPCGFHSYSRTYLRAMPLVCAADVISIILRLCTNGLAGLSIRQAATATLESRYQCCDYCDDSLPDDTLQDLENWIYLRWIVFVFGTLPAATKLFAVRGNPWTTAWASMYLINFFIIEILLIMKKSDVEYTSVNFRRFEGAKSRRQIRWEQKMIPQHTILGLTAWRLQCTLPFMYCMNFALNPECRENIRVWMFLLGLFAFFSQHAFLNRMEYPVDQVVMAELTRFLRPQALFKILGIFHTNFSSIGASVLLLISILRSPEKFSSDDKRLIQTIIMCLIMPQFTAPIIARDLLSWETWRTKVYFIHAKSDGTKEMRQLDMGAAVIFGSVMSMCIHAFIWYGFIYQAQNTYKPAWVEWLG